jgi:monofunctional biosynthetic peptidoglycan transglycosylase
MMSGSNARSRARRVFRALAGAGAVVFGVIAYAYLTLPDVRPLATTNPTTTAFMELREREAAAAGRPVKRVHRWVPYSRISINLRRAVLAAEDSAFFEHEGIDIAEIRKSIQTSIENGSTLRGASTITQQLAKNLYLSPSRDPLRKIRELMITWRLEAALSKARIFEIYLNVIEWGDLVWGAEAASRTYFGVPASALSREQAALLAGAIINPRLYSPAHPPGRLLRRQQIILARMPGYEPPAPVVVVVPVVDEPAPAETAPPEPAEEPASPTIIDGDEGHDPARESVPPSAPPEPPT